MFKWLAVALFFLLLLSNHMAMAAGLSPVATLELGQAGLLLPSTPRAQAPDPSTLSVEDLGFKTEAPSQDADLDKRKARRKWMLTTHQVLGFVTAALLTATMASGEEGEEEEHNTAQKGDSEQASATHKNLGIASGVMYVTTAAFSILAPTPPGLEPSGSSLWHRRLAWVHGPAIVLAPILGNMANESLKKNEDPSGLAALHKPVVAIGYTAFMLSLVSLYVEF